MGSLSSVGTGGKRKRKKQKKMLTDVWAPYVFVVFHFFSLGTKYKTEIISSPQPNTINLFVR